MNLAVYGTLRTGSTNTGRINHTALVFPSHQRFPAMICDRNGSGTIVEVHDVDDKTLAAYDDYEGLSAGVYRRLRMDIIMDDGTIIEAWVYLAGEKILKQSASFAVIPSGDWFNR